MAIIDRLRGVDILSPQLGAGPARQTVAWLQDEMRPLAANDEVQLHLDLRFAELRAYMAQQETRSLLNLAIAVGLILTAIGVATAVIVALS